MKDARIRAVEFVREIRIDDDDVDYGVPEISRFSGISSGCS